MAKYLFFVLIIYSVAWARTDEDSLSVQKTEGWTFVRYVRYGPCTQGWEAPFEALTIQMQDHSGKAWVTLKVGCACKGHTIPFREEFFSPHGMEFMRKTWEAHERRHRGVLCEWYDPNKKSSKWWHDALLAGVVGGGIFAILSFLR